MGARSARHTLSEPAARPTRFATLQVFLSAFALFALVQAVLMLVSQQEFDVGAAVGLAKAGVFAALPTVLGLTLLVLVIRRWHGAWRAGDRQRATRSLLFGSVAALAAWMLVDAWVAGPLVPRAWEVWLEIGAAVGVAAAVGRRPPSADFCRRSAWLVIPALLVFVIPIPGSSPGSAPGGDEPPSAAAAGAGASLPDVVLISVDTLRADRIGAYGGSRSLTPEIDRFADEGFVFERAVASSPWTVPSVASMLTGLPTVRHRAGLTLGSGATFLRSPLPAEVPTLAEHFSRAGYRSVAVVANGFLSPAMGLARGFQRFEMPFLQASAAIFLRDIPLARLILALYPVERWADYRAQGVTDAALAVLAEEAPAPLFLWVHYIDPHTPFQADPSELDLDAWGAEMRQQQPRVREDGSVVGEVFAGTSHLRGGQVWLDSADRQRVEEYYDRAVAYLDGELGRLFRALREPGRERPLVAAFTADHGEEFWDHGGFEHGHDYYREVIRIPLVFWAPGRVPAGREPADPVGLVDLAPTLLQLAGLEAPAAAAPDEGVSLASFWGQEAASVPGRMRFAEGNLYGMPAVALEEGPWRFILRSHGAVELYHAFDDPLELSNRASEHPELVAGYRALLEPRLQLMLEGQADEAPVLDAETRKALQSLGYVQ